MVGAVNCTEVPCNDTVPLCGAWVTTRLSVSAGRPGVAVAIVTAWLAAPGTKGSHATEGPASNWILAEPVTFVPLF